MKNNITRIAIAITLFLTVGLFSACNAATKTTPSNINNNTSDTSMNYNYQQDKKLALFQNMRKLWADHVIWTRLYIISAVDDRPDAQMAAARLLKNQEDIGTAIMPYYGAAAGTQLTALLKEHINIAVDLIAAAKVNDTEKLNDADSRWEQNAAEIATFLSQANPNWPKDTLVDMMQKHLETTKAEATARIKKQYGEDVKAFDAVFDHILMMSDALSAGIIKQFPEKF